MSPLISSSTSRSGRASFPEGFLFGTAASAYQYEGAVHEGSRGKSLWDNYAQKFPERNCNSDGTEAVDFYHCYRDDIKRMKEINMDSFRFSISWARVLPHGRLDRGVSKEGIKFYNDLINELLVNGITPLVTLFHWYIPQDLEDEYGGFLSEQVVEDFRDYAKLCFEEFGDRVKLWFTLNEPWVYSVAGYDTGRKAPGRCSKYVDGTCVAGMSGYEAYIVSHNMLLAHAEAVEEFRRCEKTKDGKIGIAHCPLWYEPYDSDSPDDREAVDRAMDFMFGWHMHPTAYGDYPEVMKKLVGERLPSFTPKQSQKLKKSYDFVGINYYSSVCAKSISEVDPLRPTWRTDQRVEWRKENKAGKLVGKQGGMEWMLVYPQGLRKVLKYVKDRYENPCIIITENGYGETFDCRNALYNPSIDTERVEYHEQHLECLHQAIRHDGVRVKGYFVWSLLDNFEWQSGYGVRFGLYYIDYKDGLKRYPKMSAVWLKEFPKKKKEEERKTGNGYGHQLLNSIADHKWVNASGHLPVFLGSLFVVSATIGTTLYLKSSNN